MNAPIDWEQFRAEPEKANVTPQLPQQIDFEQFRAAPSPSPQQEIFRHLARTGSRIGETIVGLPGDIAGLAQAGITSVLEKLTGHEISREELRKKMQQLGEEEGIGPIPGSSELKQLSETLTNNFTSPQSAREELGDEVVQDLTSLSLPIKGKLPFTRALGTVIAGNLAKEGIKAIGGEEKSQNLGKLGTMFLAGSFNPGGARKYMNSLYKKAEQLMPPGEIIAAEPMKNAIRDIQIKLTHGISTPSKKVVQKAARDLQKISASGSITLEDAVAAKRNLNELRGDPTLLQRDKKFLNSLSKSVDNTLRVYGKRNPEFYKNFQAANQAYAGLMQGQQLTKSLKNAIKGVKFKTPLAIALGLYSPKSFATGAVVLGGLKGVEIMHRVATNPSLRKYYLNAVHQSLKGNRAAAVRNLMILDKNLANEKLEPKI